MLTNTRYQQCVLSYKSQDPPIIYYECKQKQEEQELIKSIREIFRLSRNNYRTRKIKVELAEERKIVSRRRIGRIMKH